MPWEKTMAANTGQNDYRAYVADHCKLLPWHNFYCKTQAPMRPRKRSTWTTVLTVFLSTLADILGAWRLRCQLAQRWRRASPPAPCAVPDPRRALLLATPAPCAFNRRACAVCCRALSLAPA
eukprot:2278766-Pleurochrysis_carterae.AAC.1